MESRNSQRSWRREIGAGASFIGQGLTEGWQWVEANHRLTSDRDNKVSLWARGEQGRVTDRQARRRERKKEKKEEEEARWKGPSYGLGKLHGPSHEESRCWPCQSSSIDPICEGIGRVGWAIPPVYHILIRSDKSLFICKIDWFILITCNCFVPQKHYYSHDLSLKHWPWRSLPFHCKIYLMRAET